MKQLLENIIKEWWARPLPTILPREVNLLDYADLKVRKVITITGFRRSGKTFSLLDFAQKVGKENCVYLNLEDERLPKEVRVLTTLLDVLTELSGSKGYFLLMDEIQNIPDWETWARRVVETTSHKLFVTGISSKLSSSELPTQLRGRFLTVLVKPLSFKEFLTFKNLDIKITPKSLLLNLTREYLTYGGFPEIVLVDEGKKPLILDEYYQTFLTRDIVERHSLRNREMMKSLILLLLNSSHYTASKLANSLKGIGLKCGKSTVTRYLNFLEGSFFLKSIKLHTPSIKNRLKAERKPYFIDNYFIFRYSNEFSKNRGRLMENIVYSNLDQQHVYYWKDYRNHEVDFILREEERTLALVQVSFVSGGEVISERETSNLIKAANQVKTDKLFLVTWDFERELKLGKLKVRCIPLYKFLLDEYLN